MYIYKKVQKEIDVFDYAMCDVCKEKIDNEIELQEMYPIDFHGGYGSVFGDGNHIRCDICQHCLKKLINDFYRIKIHKE